MWADGIYEKIKLQSVKAKYQKRRGCNACKSSVRTAIVRGEKDKGVMVEERFALCCETMVQL